MTILQMVYGSNSGGGGGGRLPSTYQEVEYIKSSGNAYINTGFAPNQDTILELNFSSWTESGSVDLFGTDRNFTNSGFTLLPFTPCYGNQAIDTSTNVADGNPHTIYLGKTGYVVDGNLITTFNTQTFSSLNLYIFALNRNNYPREYSHYNFHSMKIWDNGVLVRYFIPCYRKSDSVVGLYDLLNNSFYTNSGSGSFTKGPDVWYEWKPGTNTVAYYPLTSSTTVNDKSGNNRNLTNSNVSFGTQFGVDCAYISGNADSSHSVSKYLYGNITGLPTGSSARTYSFWIYNNNANVPSVADDMYIFQGIAGTNRMVFAHGGGVDSRSGLAISQRGSSGNFGASIRKQRCYNVITYDGARFEWYVNGVSRGTWAYTINTGSNKFSIFGASENPAWNAFNGGMSELILENKARTAGEVASYYYNTKSKYGY